jgi:NAD(P)-dependent dehydrogenase (short-subunit alcohol dehydrogenase family)
LALAVLERGHRVIATSRARSLPKLAELEERGARILELDVVAPLSKLQEVAKKAVEIYGKIDVVVNNAGYVAFGALEENTYVSSLLATRSLIYRVDSPQETVDQFDTNVFGGLNVARAFLPYMRPRATGTIVWIGSLAGYR